jgi:hypothetical protein
MIDTREKELTKPADSLIMIIDSLFTDRKLPTNPHNIYEVACKVLRERLNIDEFTAKGKK